MKAQAALAHIRQLCCLGLGSEVIMPALMQALHDCIPSYQNIFFWLDEHGQYTNIYDEDWLGNLKIAQLYFKEFKDAKEKDFWPGSTVLIKSNAEILHSSTFINRKSMRTDFYNEILRGMNAHYLMYGKAQEQGRCMGIINLCRPITSKPYTLKEENNLRAIMPYIAHSLHPQADKSAFADTGEQGLAIMDTNAQVRYLCPGAQRLLFWASHTQFSPQHLPHVKLKPTPPVLQQLCQNLIAVFKGQAASAPVAELCNAWGRFVFRAHWLDPYDHCASTLIGITIQRQEPLALSITRQMQNLPLSPRLKDVCLLFAQGQTQRQIAEHLRISTHTATDYIRVIYEKLGVHNREDLLKTLQAQLMI